MRKLQQNTDEGDIIVNTVPTDIPANSPTSPTITPAEPLSDVPEVPPITTEETNSTTQPNFEVKKFHGFRQSSNKIQFGLFFSFLRRRITRTVVMRILVTYRSGRLRVPPMKTNAAGASVPTTCQIKDEFKDLVGVEGTGQNIDYDCTGEAPEGAGNITEAVIDTSTPMYVGGEAMNATDVSFSKESEVNNIADATNVAIILQNANATFENNKITLSGIATPISDAADNIKKDNTYNMAFYDVSTDGMKTVPCTVTSAGSSNGNGIPCTFECTASTPIQTYIANLTQAKIDEGNLYLTFNPDLENQAPDKLLDSTSSGSGSFNTYYRKSSSGLSGGAIAGIVIACVVSLAVASIAAIMLRKPAPPVDQTTVVGLKTVENM